MKKPLFLLASLAMILSLSLGACNNDKKTDAQPLPKLAPGEGPNIRYVDIDSIFNNYNLAKDYNEQMLSMQSSYESTVNQKGQSLQSAYNSFQKKYANSTYLSKEDQEAAAAESQRLQNMQDKSQREIAELQNKMMMEAEKGRVAVLDSIRAFLADYNKTRGYDFILEKNTTLYADPKLDITKEVIEGLNARYNKMKK